jgi:3-oxoacyl-[acyl-carrier protein] reductase
MKTTTVDSSRHVAFITGANRGIGAATAILLARRGVDVVLAVRSPDSARDVVRTIEAAGGSCLAVACDVAELATVKAAVGMTVDRFGQLDTVVNNAGQIEPIARIAESDPAAWAQAVNTNLLGPYHVVHTTLELLKATRGAIINISTGAAIAPREGWSAYCSSKAGLLMLTRAIAHEYAGDGLFACGCSQGWSTPQCRRASVLRGSTRSVAFHARSLHRRTCRQG